MEKLSSTKQDKLLKAMYKGKTSTLKKFLHQLQNLTPFESFLLSLQTKVRRSFKELGFGKCTQEQAVYTRREGEESVLGRVYVDDLIVMGSSTEKVNKFKQ
ncbi:gag-pol polyprotein [Cucumis melo var. makuwa]|uniref:Gag-pol polyprotein n=1 Tax=Cucumis melo var. makuwa TaxID=1194695 RepID=A0A5D3B9I2_CUCMM|nr:gag-pol polyprotein [Cucumis melo var. makuwa]TYJ95669.1 gag-pol polyprotein [Cucumis melo var. makuwa]